MRKLGDLGMARIRTIKPTFFRDLAICGLPIPTRLTFIGLWTYVDDEGRGVDDARLVKAELWPLDDNYTVKKVEADLVRLADLGRVCRYSVSTARYLHVVNFPKHQRVNRPYKSVIPVCDRTEHSLNDHGSNSEPEVKDHGTITDRSPPEKERKGKRKGKDENPPPADAVEAQSEPDDACRRQAHRLSVLAIEQPVKPLIRGQSNPFPAVHALIERQLRAGTAVSQVEAAIVTGVEVWTTHGLQTAIAKQRASANGREAAVVALMDGLRTDQRELP